MACIRLQKDIAVSSDNVDLLCNWKRFNLLQMSSDLYA